jgi:aarF domain-containing kinase
VRDLCFKNGGLYVKFGQHVAQLDHILPREYVEVMRACLAENPTCDYKEVCRVFHEDFGQTPEEMFASFEKQPFSSASLAQVHRAVLKDGRHVAVKVQHRGLRESAKTDIATIDLLVRTLYYYNSEVNYLWLVDETRLNLPRELVGLCGSACVCVCVCVCVYVDVLVFVCVLSVCGTDSPRKTALFCLHVCVA